MGSKQKQTLLQKIFCDSNGTIVIAQFPNTPLILWFVLSIVRLYPWPAQFDAGLGTVANAFLFVWAYLEITSGVNYFRRALGAIIMVFMMVSYFS